MRKAQKTNVERTITEASQEEKKAWCQWNLRILKIATSSLILSLFVFFLASQTALTGIWATASVWTIVVLVSMEIIPRIDTEANPDDSLVRALGFVATISAFATLIPYILFVIIFIP